MAKNCKSYCSNYFYNPGNTRADDSCMGPNDIRAPYFSCNEKLNPNRDVEREMVAELERRGYAVSRRST